MKKRKQASGMESAQGKFKLPPDVSFHKQDMTFCVAYVFRHRALGELGRVMVQPRDDGTTNLISEVVGDPADPMTQERKRIFEPLGLDLMERVAAITGVPPGARVGPPSPFPPEPKGIVESKLFSCERCGAMAAMLIFAPEATDEGRFEDYARMMYSEYARLNLPTWIIGPDLGEGSPFQRPSQILKIWPVREPLKRSSPAEFRPLLDKVVSAHCGKRRKYAYK
jgi:hypothetical protein